MNFCTKILQGLKRPQQKFVQQMIYGILAGNKLHLSGIARSLKEDIILKKPSNVYPETSILLGKSSPLCRIISPL